jgi:hypothetical protein
MADIEMEQSLIQAFVNSISNSADDRKQAEAIIKQAQRHPQYVQTLLKISAEPQQGHAHICQSAAI